jgi:hypothetical protein
MVKRKRKMQTTRGGARPGSGRKPGRVTDQNVNIRIPGVELKAAKYAAKRDGFEDNFSEFVREALRRML